MIPSTQINAGPLREAPVIKRGLFFTPFIPERLKVRSVAVPRLLVFLVVVSFFKKINKKTVAAGLVEMW